MLVLVAIAAAIAVLSAVWGMGAGAIFGYGLGSRMIHEYKDYGSKLIVAAAILFWPISMPVFWLAGKVDDDEQW